ncbi:MAG: pinensin family lanthipeptide [Bacteroidetes bacterium]|nr:pinensin family lanthipeptide [Bacteroidota bacterium]
MKKLTLSELKVESFVTELDKNQKQTVGGGDTSSVTNPQVCDTKAICTVDEGSKPGCLREKTSTPKLTALTTLIIWECYYID